MLPDVAHKGKKRLTETDCQEVGRLQTNIYVVHLQNKGNWKMYVQRLREKKTV